MSDVPTAKDEASLLTGGELLSAVNGECIGKTDIAHLCFTSVVTDSRAVSANALFIPLIGENQDGHAYIPQALEKGASVVFVAKAVYEKNRTLYESLSALHGDVAFIAVFHTMHALQAAAACYVSKFPQLVRCAVTGSSGKTTTKEITASILRQKYAVVTNKGNLNSETGLPLSVFQIRREHTLGLFEMGMNRVNEIGEIAAVLKPNYGIVTNIGTAHIGILGSREAIAEEKKKIFTYVDKNGCAVIPADDDFADFLAAGVCGKIVRYGTQSALLEQLGVHDVQFAGVQGTFFMLDSCAVHLPLPGVYNFKNALAAIALARQLAVTSEQIKAGIEALDVAESLGSRSRIRRGFYTVLEDCYNANPDSMQKALELCADVTLGAGCKKVLVLGDMLELGSESVKAHEAAGKQAAQVQPDMIVFMGEEMQTAYEEVKKLLPEARLFYEHEHTDEAVLRAVHAILAFAPKGSFVLLKASRGMALERFLPQLLGEEASTGGAA